MKQTGASMLFLNKYNEVKISKNKLTIISSIAILINLYNMYIRLNVLPYIHNIWKNIK